MGGIGRPHARRPHGPAGRRLVACAARALLDHHRRLRRPLVRRGARPPSYARRRGRRRRHGRRRTDRRLDRRRHRRDRAPAGATDGGTTGGDRPAAPAGPRPAAPAGPRPSALRGAVDGPRRDGRHHHRRHHLHDLRARCPASARPRSAAVRGLRRLPQRHRRRVRPQGRAEDAATTASRTRRYRALITGIEPAGPRHRRRAARRATAAASTSSTNNDPRRVHGHGRQRSRPRRRCSTSTRRSPNVNAEIGKYRTSYEQGVRTAALVYIDNAIVETQVEQQRRPDGGRRHQDRERAGAPAQHAELRRRRPGRWPTARPTTSSTRRPGT